MALGFTKFRADYKVVYEPRGRKVETTVQIEPSLFQERVAGGRAAGSDPVPQPGVAESGGGGGGGRAEARGGAGTRHNMGYTITQHDGA